MILFIDWNDLDQVNQEGAFIDFTAKVQVEAIHKCDSIDASEAMVTRLVNQELSDELLDKLEGYLAEQRDGVAKRLWSTDRLYEVSEADYE